MKKLFKWILGCGVFSLIACGPSAQEKAASEQRKADSIFAVDAAHIQDSIDAIEAADLARIAAQKQLEDSLKMLAMQDSSTAVKGKVKKASTKKSAEPKKEEKKKDKEQEEQLINRFK